METGSLLVIKGQKLQYIGPLLDWTPLIQNLINPNPHTNDILSYSDVHLKKNKLSLHSKCIVSLNWNFH